ncbi:MATE efflux family protein [Pholiota conissans]|uniref:MATE efflux family protein n=1 Tax=Pholiota conissans TaxID=109636 RepID=A0A9P5YZ05_9AGAR|nr:MATE efflux family protein [Pholiota conissans]
MLFSSFDPCRPASLPAYSPIHTAIRQTARTRPIRTVATYGTDLRPRRIQSTSPVHYRRRSCPPRRLSKSDLSAPILDEYPHRDIIGIDPGALPTEVTPLLNPPCRRDAEARESLETIPESQYSMFVEELSTLLRYTGPIFGTHLSEYFLLVIPVICIGHYSTTALAAITLGSMFATITGFSIIQGFISALDTVLPATWSSHPELLGLWTQRMAVLMTAILIPISILFFNAEPFLLHLKQDVKVSHLAAIYLRWISLGLPAYAFNYISRRYYKSQGRFSVPTKVTFIVAPIHAVLTYTLVFGPPRLPYNWNLDFLKLGFIGAPIATVCSFNLISTLFIIHGLFFSPRTAWTPPSRRMFSRLGVLVRLGMCGVGQIGLRLWAWEVLTLAASLLGPVALASQSILVIFASTIFRAPFALGIASSVRIGNLLGQQDARHAEVASRTAMGLVVIMSTFTSILVTAFAKYWAYIFNHDPDVIRIVARIMPLIALFQVFHGTAAVTGAIARARGKQLTGALVNLSAYYMIGFPMGLYLAFRHGTGLSGLWIGMTVSLIFCAASGLYLCLRVDWDVEVKRAMQRIKRDKLVCGCESGEEDGEGESQRRTGVTRAESR